MLPVEFYKLISLVATLALLPGTATQSDNTTIGEERDTFNHTTEERDTFNRTTEEPDTFNRTTMSSQNGVSDGEQYTFNLTSQNGVFYEQQNNTSSLTTMSSQSGVSEEELDAFNLTSQSGVSDEELDAFNLTSQSGVSDEELDAFNLTSQSGVSDEELDAFNLTSQNGVSGGEQSTFNLTSQNGVSGGEQSTFNLTSQNGVSGGEQSTFNLTEAQPQPDYRTRCVKYVEQITAKPAVHLKAEPLCTESGSALDQLIRFIGYHFDKHECGNPNSTVKYTELLYCSMLNAHSFCLQPLEDEQIVVKAEPVPHWSTVRWIIEKLCAVDHLLAKECMLKRLKYVSRCVKIEVHSILNMENKQWRYGVIDPCRNLEVKVMCMYEVLQPCNKRTASLMASLIHAHLRSETCFLSGGHPAQPLALLYCKTMFALILFLLFV